MAIDNGRHFGYHTYCPKRVGSFGYSTLASEERASEK